MQFRLITILTDKVHFELLHRDHVLTWTLSFSFAFFSLWISYKNTIIIIFSIFLLYIFQNEINNIQSSSHTLHSAEREWIQLRILSLPTTWTEKIICKNCETHNTKYSESKNHNTDAFLGTFSSRCWPTVPSKQMFQKHEATTKSYATIG
jgi:hypothetical protein